MAGDVITTDRAKKTLDTLLQRRDRFHAGGEHRQQEDDALQRLAAASAAIDDVWAQGARRVEELQRARVFGPDEAEARDAAIAASKKTLRILGIEIEEVAVEGGRIVPYRLRGRIREIGSTAPVLDRQHLDEDGHVSI